MRSDATRNHAAILEAAIGVLATAPTASMLDIARASGTGRTTLYRHFPDRDALVAAIFARVLADADAMIATALGPDRDPADPIGVLTALAGELVGLGDRYRFLQNHVRPRSEAASRADSPSARMFRTFIEVAQDDGHIRADMSAQWLSEAVGAVITRAASFAFTSPEERVTAVREGVRGLLEPARPTATES